MSSVANSETSILVNIITSLDSEYTLEQHLLADCCICVAYFVIFSAVLVAESEQSDQSSTPSVSEHVTPKGL